MAEPVVMPRLGWTMEVGSVVEWHKRDGDPVKAGEPLLAIESDGSLTAHADLAQWEARRKGGLGRLDRRGGP